MRRRELGRTGVEVSALCLGGVHFGSRDSDETSYQMLDEFFEAGGTFVDTANNYANWREGCVGGESERLIGRWMKERKNRDQIFVATKVAFHKNRLGQGGLGAEEIEAECHKSLRNLGVETIDLYYAHVDDRLTPLAETLEAFDRLVGAGKVRLIGASNYRAWRLEEARWLAETNGWAEFCCVQQRHSYLYPKPGADFTPQIAANADLLDWCRQRGTTLLAYSVLLSGAYTRADRPLPANYAGPVNQARLAALQAVAEETGATPNQVILAWLEQSDPSVLPLIGASTSAQMQENLGALDLVLSETQIERLTETINN